MATTIRPLSDEPVVLLEPDHIYTVGEGITEREVPSLSRVLEDAGLHADYSNVPKNKLEFKARIGTIVHAVAEMLLEGYDNYDLNDLCDGDEFLRLHAEPHVLAFERWLDAHDVRAVYHEVPAFQPTMEYCCTADFVGFVDGNPWILDFKTTYRIYPSVALQTMGQRMCFDGYVSRGALWLQKSGVPRVISFTNDSRDASTLMAAVTVAKNRKHYV
jgi:hypothetical protein